MSYYDGVSFGKKLYLKNLEKHGFKEREHSEKIINTCKNYAKNSRIKKTKDGRFLTKNLRLFYKGVADFLTSPGRFRY